MSQENVEIVRGMYDAYHGGATDGALRAFLNGLDTAEQRERGTGGLQDQVGAELEREGAVGDR